MGARVGIAQVEQEPRAEEAGQRHAETDANLEELRGRERPG